MDGNMIDEKENKPRPDKLPPIRVDDEVSENEPRIEIGGKKASLPSPVPFNPREA
jgi:hypothetical protein